MQEEVAIDAGDADEFSVADSEDILERFDGGGGRGDSFPLGHECGFVVTGCVRTWAQELLSVLARYLLYLAEEALPFCRAVPRALLGAPDFPIAAENQEQQNLHAEDDCGSRD